MTSSTTLVVDQLAPGDGLVPLREDWEAIESAGGASHAGRTWGWLRRWSEHYGPRRLLGLRVRRDGAPIAAGLVEERSFARWRFAGAPVTANRGLVCRPGEEAAAWAALGGWLRASAGRFSELELEGTAPDVAALPRALITRQPTYAMELPSTLDELLAARSRSARRELRKTARLLAEAGAEVAQADDRRAALARLVTLHTRRTAARGERHEAVDERLVALLDAVAADGRVAVRVFELRLGGALAASAVTLEREGVVEYHQTGMEPAHARLGPGYGVLLAVIEDAMRRGVRRLDLGPGEYLYKERVGGVRADHWRVVAPSPSARGAALRAARRLRAGRS